MQFTFKIRISNLIAFDLKKKISDLKYICYLEIIYQFYCRVLQTLYFFILFPVLTVQKLLRGLVIDTSFANPFTNRSFLTWQIFSPVTFKLSPITLLKPLVLITSIRPLFLGKDCVLSVSLFSIDCP